MNCIPSPLESFATNLSAGVQKIIERALLKGDSLKNYVLETKIECFVCSVRGTKAQKHFAHGRENFHGNNFRSIAKIIESLLNHPLEH